MSEKIPGSSPIQNKSTQNNPLPTNSLTIAGWISTDVDLAPIIIYPSRYLWLGECAIYAALALSASIALFPFLLTAFYLPVLGLLFLLFVGYILRTRWRAKSGEPLVLSIQQNCWYLKINNSNCVVSVFDNVLLWSAMIILPLRETESGKKHIIVVLPDSLAGDDWRRLRVWLRTCFRQ